MAATNAPAVLATGTGTAHDVTPLDVSEIDPPWSYASDSNAQSSRVYSDRDTRSARIWPAGTEPGVSAHGDDRAHE